MLESIALIAFIVFLAAATRLVLYVHRLIQEGENLEVE